MVFHRKKQVFEITILLLCASLFAFKLAERLSRYLDLLSHRLISNNDYRTKSFWGTSRSYSNIDKRSCSSHLHTLPLRSFRITVILAGNCKSTDVAADGTMFIPNCIKIRHLVRKLSVNSHTHEGLVDRSPYCHTLSARVPGNGK